MTGDEWQRWPPSRVCCRRPCPDWRRNSSTADHLRRLWERRWSCRRACPCPRQRPVCCPAQAHPQWSTLDWSTRHRTAITRTTLHWRRPEILCWQTTRIIAVRYTVDKTCIYSLKLTYLLTHSIPLNGPSLCLLLLFDYTSPLLWLTLIQLINI